jgi:bifunctional UDP-N-acetylglucosamine pyrophosphorylase/glucosamine-1-phosphate N-acetyltransferase
MRSATPKVLHELGGRSMLGHVVAATRGLEPDRLLVVVGHGRDRVVEQLAAIDSDAKAIVQGEQRGTGHAVRVALEESGQVDGELDGEVDGAVVVVPGDAPLLTTACLAKLLDERADGDLAAVLLTAEMPDPSGYGRVVRDADGRVCAVVEHRDADEAQRAIREVATSVYAFAARPLSAALGRLRTDNAQGEEYLTDVVADFVVSGAGVGAVRVADYRETLGVNDRVQLAAVGGFLRERVVEQWMRAGVTVVDPDSTWIGVDVTLEADSVLLPNTHLQGATRVERGAEVGPNCTLRDTHVGAGARVRDATCESAYIGPEATVGPFTYLRPGTRLGRRAKAGSYVEIKAATVGEGSKVPHLSYVGDASIGERANIGAATVFVNYDGAAKHRTEVGDDARVGSDTMLVAPVRVGDGAYTAAGSVITEDVPPGALAVARGRQRNIEGWVERRRPGTPAAESARRARESGTGADSADGNVKEGAPR